MSRRGPPPAPPELKVLKGVTRIDRLRPDRPETPQGRPEPPADLTTAEAEAFREIVGRLDLMGIASPADVGIIALAAKRRVEIGRLDESIEEDGLTYFSVNRDGQQFIKANPAVRMRSEAMRHLHSLESTLGLSPSDRGRVSGGKKEEEVNPYAGLRGG